MGIKIYRGEERTLIIKVTSKACDEDACGGPVDITGAALAVEFPHSTSGRKIIRRSSTQVINFLPAAVSTSADTITLTTGYGINIGHGLCLNDVVTLTTTGTLPAGLATSTNYYVIVSDQNTIQLAASANGSAINITDTGSGVHTVVPTSVASISGNAILGQVSTTLSEEATAELKVATGQDIVVGYTISNVLRYAVADGVLTVENK